MGSDPTDQTVEAIRVSGLRDYCAAKSTTPCNTPQPHSSLTPLVKYRCMSGGKLGNVHFVQQNSSALTNLVLQRHVTPQNTRLRVPDDIILIVAHRTYFNRFKQGDVTRHEPVERNQ